MLALALLACRPDDPEPWVETRAACGLAPDDVAVYPNESIEAFDKPFVYDEACATAIGDDLGVEWEVFGAVDLPGFFRGTTLERAIAGAWLVLAMDAGTVGELLAHPDSPEDLRSQLTELTERYAIPDDAPASRVVYDYVADRIVRTRPKLGRYNVAMTGATLRLPSEQGSDRVYWWMGVVMHEAAHVDHRSHVECATGKAVGWDFDQETDGDDSWEGAYGVQFFLAARYRTRLEGAYWTEMRQVLAATKYMFCPGVDIPPDIYEYDAWE